MSTNKIFETATFFFLFTKILGKDFKRFLMITKVKGENKEMMDKQEQLDSVALRVLKDNLDHWVQQDKWDQKAQLDDGDRLGLPGHRVAQVLKVSVGIIVILVVKTTDVEEIP